eukprot:15365365-Ditylum_brightwellii.AAC.1
MLKERDKCASHRILLAREEGRKEGNNEDSSGEENKNNNDEGFIEKGVSSVNYALTGSSV